MVTTVYIFGDCKICKIHRKEGGQNFRMFSALRQEVQFLPKEMADLCSITTGSGQISHYEDHRGAKYAIFNLAGKNTPLCETLCYLIMILFEI